MAGKINVVFASLLKPVDEPRMYYKLGRSLAKTNKYAINIIGFRSKNLVKDPAVTFWPLFDFPRISLQRALAPLHYYRKLLQLKPELIILTTPDLLLVSVLYKILFGAKLVYDIQENNYRNIIWSHASPTLFRRARALMSRGKERLLNRMFIHYTLAERCYINECSFILNDHSVFENKALRPVRLPLRSNSQPDKELRILFAGTISESYGILDTLPLLDKIAELHPHLCYTICGHCPKADLEAELHRLAKDRPWMRLLIAATPLPHEQILQELRSTHFSLIAYRINPANKDCRPTRIWEALAGQVPMILKEEHPWREWVSAYQGGFSVDFSKPNPAELYQKLFHTSYYTRPLPADIYWESDEDRWVQLVDRLMQD